MILIALFACTNTNLEPADEPAITNTPAAGSSSSSSPNWGTSTGSGNGNGNSNNGGNEQNNDEDPDNTDPEDETDGTLNSGVYYVDSGDPDPLPSPGTVIIGVYCEGVDGLQVHAMSEDGIWNQDYWFDVSVDTGDAQTAFDNDDGEYLLDDEVDETMVLWSEFPSDKDSLVKVNGYAWVDGNVQWMVQHDVYIDSICVAVMIHDDGTGKVCLPEDNGMDGGDIICDPIYNGQGMAPAFIEALEEAMARAY